MRKNDDVYVLQSTGATNECGVKPHVKTYYNYGVGDKAKYTENMSWEIYRVDCKNLSGSDKSHKEDEGGKRKDWGKPSTCKLRLPQEREASGSGEMNKAFTPEVEIVVARTLSHLTT